MTKVKWLFFAYLALLVLIVAAIGASMAFKPPHDPHTFYSTYGANLKSLDPAVCNDSEAGDLLGYVYECLYNYKYGVTPYVLAPEIAADLPTISPDGLTYTIPIRKGIHFFDSSKTVFPDGTGPEIRAADVIYSYKRVADFNLASPNYSTMFQGRVAGIDDWFDYTQKMANEHKPVDYDRPVEGLKALDDYTVQIKLVDTNPQFRYILAYGGSAIVSRDAVNKFGDKFDKHPVGTGPYYLAVNQPEQRVIFEANPIYRGRPDVDGLTKVSPEDRLPKISRLQLDYFLEALPAWFLFERGQFDSSGIPKETFAQAVDGKTQTLKPAFVAQHMRLRVAELPEIDYFGFNMTDPVVGKNKPLRQAISMGYDREKYIQIYLNGRAIPANGPIPPTFECYDKNYLNPYCVYNPEAARAKVKEAEKVQGGPIPELTLFLGGTDTGARQEGDFFVSQMRQIGITVKVDYNEYARFQDLVDHHQTQIFQFGWIPDYPDEQTFLQLFYGKFAAPGMVNSSAYSNPEYDKIYAQAVTMNPSPQRLKLYKQLVAMVDEDCPWVCLTYPTAYGLTYTWLSVTPHMDYGYGFIQYLRLDEKMREKYLGPR